MTASLYFCWLELRRDKIDLPDFTVLGVYFLSKVATIEIIQKISGSSVKSCIKTHLYGTDSQQNED